MSKKSDKRSVSLSLTVISEVDRRSPGKSAAYFSAPTGISPVLDRDLTRLYALYNELRPTIEGKFTSNDLDCLAGIWAPYGIIKHSPTITKNLLLSAVSGPNPMVASKITDLSSAEVLALVDLIEEKSITAIREKQVV